MEQAKQTLQVLTLLFCKFLFTLTIELRIVSNFAVAVNIKVVRGIIQTKRLLFGGNNRLDIFLEFIQQRNEIFTAASTADGGTSYLQ